jgi:hypothetical protein
MSKDASGRDTGYGGWADRVSNDGDRFLDDLIGWNFVTNTNNPMDDYGHGTHVAGSIGAVGNNWQGVCGVAWNVQLMAVKFLDGSGNGSIDKYIAALRYAVAKGAKVSNNSWTGASYSSDLVTALNEARAAGHIFVAAAGNQGSNNDAQAVYPAGFQIDNIVSVAATDRYDNLAGFSNYGAQSVTLAAPGVDILSTTRGNTYGSNSGTSMATPHVVGTLALVWSIRPTWTYRQVITQVVSTVDRLPSLTGKVSSSGRVNAARAVGVVQAQSTPPRITSAVPSGPAAHTLSKVRVTFDRAIALSSFSRYDVLLTGPSGQAIYIWDVRVVAGSGDRTFDITFATQTAAGAYNLRIGPEVTDLTGTRMSIYTNTFRLNPPLTYTSWTRVTVPRWGRGVPLLTINQDVRISDLNVKLNITHPRVSDLYILLQAPDGTTIVLFNRHGGPTANLINTVFDDSATRHIGLGIGPFTGSYQPVVALSNFNNKSARGTWKLWVMDRGGSSTGTINNWSLIVTPRV